MFSDPCPERTVAKVPLDCDGLLYKMAGSICDAKSGSDYSSKSPGGRVLRLLWSAAGNSPRPGEEL